MATSGSHDELASELLNAVIQDDSSKVLSALKSGADPNHSVFWGKGWTPPLHYACLKGTLSIVMLLVKGGADTRRLGGKPRMSPLHWACRYGCDEVAKYLLENKLSDLSSVDDRGETALDKALSNVAGPEGFVKAAYMLVSRGCGSSKHKLRLLLGACRKGKMSIVKDMIDTYKVDPKSRDQHNDSPLHQACAGGQLAVARYLIEEIKCPTDTKGFYNNSILHYACHSGNLSLVQYLVEDRKVDTGSKSDHGRRPLHYACVYGFKDVVEYLVKNANCDVTIMDDWSHTPLHRACYGDNLEVVKYLVEELHCDYSGESARRAETDTVLHCACQGGHMPTVKYLVEELKCKYTEYKGDSGGCPIHQACSKGNLAVVKYLIEDLKCDPNIRGRSDMTPLHYASYEGHLEVVQYLAPKVGTSLTDSYGRTALDIAEQGEKTSVVAYLRARYSTAYQLDQEPGNDEPGVADDGYDNAPKKAAALAKESSDILQLLLQKIKLTNQDKSLSSYKAEPNIKTEEDIAICLKELRRSLWSMKDSWENIAIELNIPEPVKKSVREKSSDLGGQLTALIEVWLKGKPSASDLLEALRFDILNRPDIADDIERKINSGTLPLL